MFQAPPSQSVGLRPDLFSGTTLSGYKRPLDHQTTEAARAAAAAVQSYVAGTQCLRESSIQSAQRLRENSIHSPPCLRENNVHATLYQCDSPTKIRPTSVSPTRRSKPSSSSTSSSFGIDDILGKKDTVRPPSVEESRLSDGESPHNSGHQSKHFFLPTSPPSRPTPLHPQLPSPIPSLSSHQLLPSPHQPLISQPTLLQHPFSRLDSLPTVHPGFLQPGAPSNYLPPPGMFPHVAGLSPAHFPAFSSYGSQPEFFYDRHMGYIKGRQK